jgi:hypothetical protein
MDKPTTGSLERAIREALGRKRWEFEPSGPTSAMELEPTQRELEHWNARELARQEREAWARWNEGWGVWETMEELVRRQDRGWRQR